MKGVELPINTLIIIVLGVIILVAVIALVLGVWSPSSVSLSSQTVKNTKCVQYVSQGCKDGNLITFQYNGEQTNFDAFCTAEFGQSCPSLCNCGPQ